MVHTRIANSEDRVAMTANDLPMGNDDIRGSLSLIEAKKWRLIGAAIRACLRWLAFL
jgi:hypothetical protein